MPLSSQTGVVEVIGSLVLLPFVGMMLQLWFRRLMQIEWSEIPHFSLDSDAQCSVINKPIRSDRFDPIYVVTSSCYTSELSDYKLSVSFINEMYDL